MGSFNAGAVSVIVALLVQFAGIVWLFAVVYSRTTAVKEWQDEHKDIGARLAETAATLKATAETLERVIARVERIEDREMARIDGVAKVHPIR